MVESDVTAEEVVERLRWWTETVQANSTPNEGFYRFTPAHFNLLMSDLEAAIVLLGKEG